MKHSAMLISIVAICLLKQTAFQIVIERPAVTMFFSAKDMVGFRSAHVRLSTADGKDEKKLTPVEKALKKLELMKATEENEQAKKAEGHHGQRDSMARLFKPNMGGRVGASGTRHEIQSLGDEARRCERLWREG